MFYRYGLVARPFIPGNCPDGYVDVQQFDTWTEIPGDDPRKVRAVVTYDRPLTAAELARYSLCQCTDSEVPTEFPARIRRRIQGDDPQAMQRIVEESRRRNRRRRPAESERTSVSVHQVGGGRLEPDVEYICHAVDTGKGFDLGEWSLEATTDGWTLTGPEGVVDADMLPEVAVATTIDHLLP